MGVDTALRFVLVGLHIVTIAGGFMTAIGLGWTTRIFDDKCVLYCDMDISPGKNNSVTLEDTSDWGSIDTCYYCTFSTGMAAIYAIIWFWFYFLLSEWDETNTLEFSLRILRYKTPPDSSPPDSRLLFPTLLLNVILWVCVTISLGLISKGSKIWCTSILQSLNQPCSFVSTVEWNNVPDGRLAYTYLRIAQAGNWILVFAILAKILVVSCRVYLYLKRDPGSPRVSTRHHNSLAAKFVSFTDEQRRQLEQLEQSSFDDEDQEIFHDIPFADTEYEDADDNMQSGTHETKQLIVHAPEKSYHQNSFSSYDSGPVHSSSREGLKKSDSEEDDNLIDAHGQSFKYNTL